MAKKWENIKETSAEDLIPVPVNYPKQWGVAEVIDYWGNVINLG